MKYLAVVLACGIYQGHNRLCLEWTDKQWYSTREQCIKRGSEIVKSVDNMLWYVSGFKLEKRPVPSCREAR